MQNSSILTCAFATAGKKKRCSLLGYYCSYYLNPVLPNQVLRIFCSRDLVGVVVRAVHTGVCQPLGCSPHMHWQTPRRARPAVACEVELSGAPGEDVRNGDSTAREHPYHTGWRLPPSRLSFAPHRKSWSKDVCTWMLFGIRIGINQPCQSDHIFFLCLSGIWSESSKQHIFIPIRCLFRIFVSM